ncbi:hypothetical protein [Loigolactobacillus bifermentans]|uniref:Uncharacterized protein n=1 Tax=Loigolactobacillus bifermentans DSM 20003 TaxID=1423726 RepID=A0A0R1GEY1_9LACO|nr:hypothetical protein [Loigolactobacillus bifermentans]KRK32632.1 hypothetical protein FC07_GL002063 [Loigolactobacillus bifermentans DSM 20003]QGG60298.1 hypothetical protein LB003_07410 [Loigolactobacillus bifermentans]
MEMNTTEFLNTLTDATYLTHTVTLSAAQLKQPLAPQLAAGFAALKQDLTANKISQLRLELPFEVPATIELQAGVINLPFELSKKIALLTEADTQRAVNLYLITTAENLNASGMRIDRQVSVTAFLEDYDAAVQKITAAIETKLTELTTAGQEKIEADGK